MEISIHGPEVQTPPCQISDAMMGVAGELAPLFAQLDSFPHTKILEKPRTHFHLLAIVLSTGGSLEKAKSAFQCRKFRDACTAVFGFPVVGLEGVLKKAPPTLFGIKDYTRLSQLILDGGALKVLRHSSVITNNLIETLFELPCELRTAGVVKNLRHPAEAQIVKLACRTSAKDAELRLRLANRLSNIRVAENFWGVVCTELVRQMGPVPAPPKIDHPNFFPVTELAEVLQLADKFRNCLRRYVGDVRAGSLSLYQFIRGNQIAVIGISPRFGRSGCIKEIKGPENERLPRELYEEITQILIQNGFVMWSPPHFREIDDIPEGIEHLTNCTETHEIEKVCDLVIELISEKI